MTLSCLDFLHTLISKLFFNAVLPQATKCHIDIVSFPILGSLGCCIVQVRLVKVSLARCFFHFLYLIQMDRLERNSGVDQCEIIDVRLCFNSGL